MNSIATPRRLGKDQIVNLMLNGGRVTATFRDALFDVTAREGLSVNEFCLKAAAEKLKASGREFSGVFHPGDLKNTQLASPKA